jgi:hypothetical protein
MTCEECRKEIRAGECYYEPTNCRDGIPKFHLRCAIGRYVRSYEDALLKIDRLHEAREEA